MKYALLTLLFTGFTVLFANQTETSLHTNEAVKQAIQRVENARVNTITSLQKL